MTKPLKSAPQFTWQPCDTLIHPVSMQTTRGCTPREGAPGKSPRPLLRVEGPDKNDILMTLFMVLIFKLCCASLYRVLNTCTPTQTSNRNAKPPLMTGEFFWSGDLGQENCFFSTQRFIKEAQLMDRYGVGELSPECDAVLEFGMNRGRKWKAKTKKWNPSPSARGTLRSHSQIDGKVFLSSGVFFAGHDVSIRLNQNQEIVHYNFPFVFFRWLSSFVMRFPKSFFVVFSVGNFTIIARMLKLDSQANVCRTDQMLSNPFGTEILNRKIKTELQN